MIKIESKENNFPKSSPIEKICNLSYLFKTMGGKKHLINEIIDTFIKQVNEELQFINDAITKTDYAIIKNIAHKMKSSVSIMGISVLVPVLQEMVDLGTTATDIKKIKQLNHKLNLICRQTIEEIEKDKHNFV